jgi:prepilin-type N-terminal cleavage/methylation domain-containing protein
MSRGFSLLELSIAMAVLLVGLLGGIVVISMASVNNGRSRFHTNAATMAQSALERILAIPQSATGTAAQSKIMDCAGNTFTIETAVGGSDIITGGGAFSGSIDFSKPPVPFYSMSYAMCSSAGGGIYDVRWRVDPGPTPSTQVITVGARTVNASGAAMLALPYTLRHLRGDF